MAYAGHVFLVPTYSLPILDTRATHQGAQLFCSAFSLWAAHDPAVYISMVTTVDQSTAAVTIFCPVKG